MRDLFAAVIWFTIMALIFIGLDARNKTAKVKRTPTPTYTHFEFDYPEDCFTEKAKYWDDEYASCDEVIDAEYHSFQETRYSELADAAATDGAAWNETRSAEMDADVTIWAIEDATADAAMNEYYNDLAEEATAWATQEAIYWATESAWLTKEAPNLGYTCAPGGCLEYPYWCEPPIKGNVAYDSGEKIYHLPRGEFYDSTQINPSYGERWFCTEDEAINAGWRRSHR